MKIQIINSKGYWAAGWFGKPERINFVIDKVLNKAGFDIAIDEVSNISELETLLGRLSSDTLVWTNAYYVDTKDGDTDWLNKYVEKNGLPLFGSGAKVLENLLQKDVCQSILSNHNIPVPGFAVLSANDSGKIEAFFSNCEMDYPMVLKPTAECLSLGVCLVYNHKEAVEKGRAILQDYPTSNLIAEEFLPNDDITCGYVELGDDILLMPTHYGYANKPGNSHIYNFDDRLVVDNPNRQRSIVIEPGLRKQLEMTIPKTVEVLGIKDITRIDGRPDKSGKLRYFDINGFPGLSGKGIISDMVAQAFLFFPNYPQIEVYRALINTVISNALMRNGLPVPVLLNAQNLFTLESDSVIRTRKNISVQMM